MSLVHSSTEVVLDRSKPLVFVVEDDSNLRSSLRDLLELNEMTVEDFASAEGFLASVHSHRKVCLLLDLSLPGGMGGMELLRRLQDTKCSIPTIFITGSCNVKMAIECMRLGALDLIQKPIDGPDLVARIADAVGQKCWRCDLFDSCQGATDKVLNLTSRQRQVLALVMAGHSGRSISVDLGINQRTAEKHRAEIMKKMGAKSIFDLTQLFLASSGMGFCGSAIPGRPNPVPAALAGVRSVSPDTGRRSSKPPS